MNKELKENTENSNLNNEKTDIDELLARFFKSLENSSQEEKDKLISMLVEKIDDKLEKLDKHDDDLPV